MEASVTIRFPSLAPTKSLENECIPGSRSTPVPVEPSDEFLVTQIKEGSREALGLLFRRYARLVRTIANRILRNGAEADDLLQELFLFIYRKSATFDQSKSSARSWIVQMAYHRSIDRRRYLEGRHFYTQVNLTEAAEVIGPCAEHGASRECSEELVGKTTVQGLLAPLTEDQRNTLSLHFYEGYTFAEIASKLDQSLGNIRNHYYRGLEKLRKQMFSGKLSGRNGYGRK